MGFNLIAEKLRISQRKICVSTLYSMMANRRKMATYIVILSSVFPFFDLKCMLPSQEIIIPCCTIWGGKNIKIKACPTMSIANLDQNRY